MKPESFRKLKLEKEVPGTDFLIRGKIDLLRIKILKSDPKTYGGLLRTLGFGEETLVSMPVAEPLRSLSNVHFDFYEVGSDSPVAHTEKLIFQRKSTNKGNKLLHAVLRLVEREIIAPPIPEEEGFCVHFIYFKPAGQELMFYNIKLIATAEGKWGLSHNDFMYSDIESGDALVLVS